MLGAVQGIAEWLPISSEGINSLIMVNFFEKSLSEAIIYSLWLHTGTLLSATVYFRGELSGLIRNLPGYIKSPGEDTSENRTTTFLLISTLFSGIIGAPIVLYGIDRVNFSGEIATAFIGFLLIITGLLQKYSKKSSAGRSITRGDSVFIGVLQAFSALPGISRSGITTSGLLLRRYEAQDALKLSFLMSIPAVLAAEIGLGLLGKFTLDAYSVLAMAISFVFGLLTIGWLMKIASRVNFGNFCVFLGLLSLAAALL